MASAQQLIGLGISRGHAYDILAGRQIPSLALSLRIYDALGDKVGVLTGLDEGAIEKLRQNKAAA